MIGVQRMAPSEPRFAVQLRTPSRLSQPFTLMPRALPTELPAKEHATHAGEIHISRLAGRVMIP